MELTYQVRGTDGQTYGPVTLDELKEWLRQGRVDQETQILRSDTANWDAAAKLPELGFAPARQVAVPPSATRPAQEQASEVDPEVRGAVSWLYWIVGLSAVNSVMAHTGGDWRFFFGLGLTQLVDYSGSLAFAVVVDLVVYGLFIWFARAATLGRRWALITGMGLYALDAVLFLITQEWLGLALHGYVLFRLFRGLQILNAARA